MKGAAAKKRGRTRKRKEESEGFGQRSKKLRAKIGNAEKPRTWSKEEIKKEKSKTGKKEEKKNGRGIFGISRK
jgi:hypothetical protein